MMMLAWLLSLAILVIGTIAIMNKLFTPKLSSKESLIKILEAKYISGEITKEEFEKIINVLKGD